jgi:uncharacterized protein YndB with AHSA1/START domain
MTATTTDRELVLTRVLNAPRERVWQAYTDPKELIQWWGPDGFTNTFHEIDIRPGGLWRFMMHGPDGTDYPNRILFHEVVKPELLTFTHGSDEVPNQFEVTITFEEQDGKTKLTQRMIFPSAEELQKKIVRVGAIEKGNQTLDKLEKHLAKM